MSSPASPDAEPQTSPAPEGTAAPKGERPKHAFLRSPAGHAALLGAWGAVLMTFGSFGSGSVRRVDPLLEDIYLSWLRFGHGQLLSRIILWVGVLLMIAAWVRVGRATLAGHVTVRDLWTVLPAWTAPLLVATPMFSRDAYSYLAQGALLRDGFDPYEVGPVVNPASCSTTSATCGRRRPRPTGPSTCCSVRASRPSPTTTW